MFPLVYIPFHFQYPSWVYKYVSRLHKTFYVRGIRSAVSFPCGMFFYSTSKTIFRSSDIHLIALFTVYFICTVLSFWVLRFCSPWKSTVIHFHTSAVMSFSLLWYYTIQSSLQSSLQSFILSTLPLYLTIWSKINEKARNEHSSQRNTIKRFI